MVGGAEEFLEEGHPFGVGLEEMVSGDFFVLLDGVVVFHEVAVLVVVLLQDVHEVLVAGFQLGDDFGVLSRICTTEISTVQVSDICLVHLEHNERLVVGNDCRDESFEFVSEFDEPLLREDMLEGSMFKGVGNVGESVVLEELAGLSKFRTFAVQIALEMLDFDLIEFLLELLFQI
jgi:hypothetical protein